jgi:hypothetical protein
MNRIDEQPIDLRRLGDVIDRGDSGEDLANLRDEHLAVRDVLLADDKLRRSATHELRVIAPSGLCAQHQRGDLSRLAAHGATQDERRAHHGRTS